MRDNLYDIIDKLPSNKQLLFGISCVYRMETYLHKYFVNKELTSFLIRLIDDIFFQCTSERFNPSLTGKIIFHKFSGYFV